MTEEIYTRLIEQAPGLAVAVLLVFLFLRYLEGQSKATHDFLERERLARQTESTRLIVVLDKLVESQSHLSLKQLEIDTFLRTSIDAMRVSQTKRRKDDTRPLTTTQQ